MISLFLGEFYAMRPSRRVILVLAGAALAFAFNIIRTLILCLVGANSGIDRIHSWHDSAGLTILFACLLGLWAVSLVLKPKDEAPSPKFFSSHRSGTDRFSGLALSLAVWIGFIEIAAMMWYDFRGPKSDTENTWKVAWPVASADYKNSPIPEAATALLRYNDGGAATWTTEGRHWMMFYFKWLPGRNAALSVKVHRPDICIPASGVTLQKDNGIQASNVNGITLPIRSYRFDDNGRTLHVFYCYWDNRTSYETVEAAIAEDWTPKGRLRTAWLGRRERGARMLELAVWGYETETEAREALQKQLEQIIRQS
jgi:exosortase/archaeosortase family protein